MIVWRRTIIICPPCHYQETSSSSVSDRLLSACKLRLCCRPLWSYFGSDSEQVLADLTGSGCGVVVVVVEGLYWSRGSLAGTSVGHMSNIAFVGGPHKDTLKIFAHSGLTQIV